MIFNDISATNFRPTTTLDRKRSEHDSEKLRVRKALTTTFSALPTDSLVPSGPLNLNLSKHAIRTLEEASGSDVAELIEFKSWASSGIVLESIKPTTLYRYFVYLLREHPNHLELLSVAEALRKVSLNGTLDPRKISALTQTVFANNTPILPKGTKLTAPIATPHLNGLSSDLLGRIFCYLSNNDLLCLNKSMYQIVAHPVCRQVANRNFKVSRNPALIRWVSSLGLSTINWAELYRVLGNEQTYIGFRNNTRANRVFPLADGRLATEKHLKLSILKGVYGPVELTIDFSKHLPPIRDHDYVTIEVTELPDKCLIVEMGSLLSRVLLVYDSVNGEILYAVNYGSGVKYAAVGTEQLIISTYNSVEVRNLHTGELHGMLSGEMDKGYNLLVSLPGGLLAYTTFRDDDIHIWDLKTDIKRILKHTRKSPCEQLVVTPNGWLVSEYQLSPLDPESEICVWDPATGDRISSFKMRTDQTSLLPRLLLPLPYDLIVSSVGREIHLIRTSTGEHIGQVNGFEEYELRHLKASTNGVLITGDWHLNMIPELLAAAITPIHPSLPQPALTQPRPSPHLAGRVAARQRRYSCWPQQVRLWLALSVLVSVIAWAWLRR